ncbi:MAG: hypothetical protein HY907_21765 [Deltaproteobacteria bacterium]|nr:hypothetical protein [Deltaproteobacteria bacterium]
MDLDTTRTIRSVFPPRGGLALALAAVALAGGACRKGARSGADGSSGPGGVEPPVVLADPVARAYSDDFLETVKEAASASSPPPAPERPGKLVVTLSGWSEERESPYQVTLDTSQQVLGLSVPEDVSYGDRAGAVPVPLAPSLAGSGASSAFRSASALAFKAKQFDDGLYAAVELAVDQGAGTFVSRRQFLADVAAALQASASGAGETAALALLRAATELGGHPVDVPAPAVDAAATLTSAFLASALESKPLGFYTWSRELSAIFQRDRLLQRVLEPGASAAMAQALARGADLLARYNAELGLPSRLTNGLARGDLATAAAAAAAGGPSPAEEELALFPPSRAYETDLIKRLYGQSPIPDDFQLADELVRGIADGRIDLTPRTDSGWYDYQTWALEPLVVPERMPEAAHLQLDDSYKKELVKLFKALLALTRETHVKQLEIPSAGAAAPPPGLVLHLSPRLSQEPLATFYLRRALAYRFVRGVLAGAFGAEGLGAMKRITAGGPINLPLDRELALLESLFYGAYANTMLELGAAPEEQQDLGWGLAESLAVYRAWDPAADPDVGRDVRMMVPVFFDVERRKTKVWAVLGVDTRPLQVYFAKAPVLESVTDEEGSAVDPTQVTMDYESAEFTVAYPVMAELYVDRILDREEFRALCDRYKTAEEILAHLQ